MHGLAGTPNAFTHCHADVHLLHGCILISQQPGVVRKMRCPIQRLREKYELLGKKKLSTRSGELVWISHPMGEKNPTTTYTGSPGSGLERKTWKWERKGINGVRPSADTVVGWNLCYPRGTPNTLGPTAHASLRGPTTPSPQPLSCHSAGYEPSATEPGRVLAAAVHSHTDSKKPGRTGKCKKLSGEKALA